ncbi:AI-2E family transporter [Parabacteroides faecis]|uniref:AI-2E family transporter n=1 Tax=Parabacteroides faecis TaxID=1217282 RepID=UPI0021660F2D|nr:AI-2E family transporter [Parabacteroides faecis]MCS2890091.1 AI-2E family transporter [Parabacteroides faecis]
MNSLFERPFTFDRVTRIVFSIVIIGALLYLITILRTALLPFLIAWLLAYMMQPFVKFFQYKLKLKSRILAIIAVIICASLIIGAAAALVVPSIAQEAERTLNLMRTHNPGEGHIPLIPESWITYLENNVDINQLMELLSRENIQNAIKQLAPKVWNILSNTFSILFSITIIFVILLYFIFILLDYEKIANGWINLIPAHIRPFAKGLADDVEQSMNRYFRGQSLIALCVGVLLAIGFKIVGFPLGVTLGLFIGVLNLIPYLQTIGLIPMVILSLLKSAETGDNFWLILGSGLLILGIVQCIQDLYLTPRIMGKAMGLNPAIILLSLSIWGTLLGFIGLIIALPLTTLCLSYYKRFILLEGGHSSSPASRYSTEGGRKKVTFFKKRSSSYCKLKNKPYLCTRNTEVKHTAIQSMHRMIR